MIYLITGSPGTGKTSLAVDMILSNYDGLFKMTAEDCTLIDRPLYFCHIDGLDERKLKAHRLTEEQIQSAPLNDLVPAGSVVIVDECDYAYPVRSAAKAVPAYVQTLKELRHHGYTLILMTQHPTMIDTYIRKLVCKHIHLERKMLGTKRYEWFRCEELLGVQSFAQAVPSNYTPSKKAFSYYQSATKHIKFKKKLHPIFYVLLLLAAVFIALFYSFISNNAFTRAEQHSSKPPPLVEQQAATAQTEVIAASEPLPPPQTQATKLEDSRNLKADDFVPIIAERPESAPIYNQVRRINDFPQIVGCVSSANRCNCYTQQATVVEMTKQQCLQHLNNRPFNAYREPNRQTVQAQAVEQDEFISQQSVFSLSGENKLTLQ